MKKNVLASCLAIITFAGCSSDNCQNGQCTAENDFSSQSQALVPRNFGETGGAPWGIPAKQLTVPYAGGLNYGRTIRSGYINGNQAPDIVTSSVDKKFHGRLTINWDAPKLTPQQFEFPKSTGMDNYGADIAVGKYCPDLTKYDIIVASAPYFNNNAGGFDLIYRGNSSAIVKSRRKIINTIPNEVAGVKFAIADIDSDADHTNDLVYLTTPIDENGEYIVENAEIRIIYDFCAINGNIDTEKYTVVAKGIIGTALYTADLNQNGTTEIIVVDNFYSTDASSSSQNGAIYFYKFDHGQFVQSRKPVIGDANQTSGASIESVAFSDIDGDGDLDLIVGEPMYNTNGKREGRVRTYTNNGGDFDSSVMAWSATAGRSHARFGSSVTISDVNNDGHDDLIVGAPGWRQAGESQERSQGYVYVYLGTGDGSIFSKDPYWTHVSNVPTTNNDDYGRTVHVADLNGKGWKDIIVGAPGSIYQDPGRIDVFEQTSAPCYTADKCLIDEQCYENGEPSARSKCQICDPTRDNFGFVPLSCDAKETACTLAATCDDKLGCIAHNKEEGTPCGNNVCADTTRLSVQICRSGVCIIETHPCKEYQLCTNNVCDYECESDSECPAGKACINYSCQTTSCKVDADCAENEVCRNSTCSFNNPPFIAIDDSLTVARGTSVMMPVTITDPDNDPIVTSWTGDAAQFLDDTTLPQPTLTIPMNAEIRNYPLHVTATDSFGASKTADITIEVVKNDNLGVTIDTIANGSTLYASDVRFGGRSNASGMINVTDGTSVLCRGEIRNHIWECSAELAEGQYTVHAEHADDPDIQSTQVTFSVRLIPRITVPVDNATVSSPVIIAGTSTPETTIFVNVMTADDKNVMQCQAVTDKNGEWACPAADIDAGDYTATAIVNIGSSVHPNHRIHFTVQDNLISITSPVDGENVSDALTVRGIAPDGNEISVYDTDNTVLCSAESAEGVWECSPNIAAGSHTITASTEIDGEKITSAPVSFAFSITKPVITSPRDGDTVGIHPEFTGTAPGASGSIDVWKSENSTSTRLCTASVGNDGTWTCTVGDLLEHEKTYSVHASWQDGGSSESPVSSDIIHITTEAAPPSSLEIITPVDQSKISVYAPVIFSGKSDPLTSVTVNGLHNGSIEVYCEATANENGRWACPDVTLSEGSHTVQAVLKGDSGIASPKITFEVAPIVSNEDKFYELQGGSCSAAPGPVSGNAAWLLLFAGFGSLALLRRRKEA